VRIRLRKTQSQTISEFSNDIAKGLMLAALLGQVINENKSISTNLFNFLGTLAGSVVFLIFAVKFRKKI